VREPGTRAKVFWSFAAIYLIWGSTYLGIHVGIQTIPPFTLAAVRFLIAGGALYLWARLRGEPGPGPRTWGLAAGLGTLFFVFGNGLVVWAEQFVPSGRTALLASTAPIWTVFIESALDRWKRPPARVIIGIVCGMLGLALLASPDEGGGKEGVVSILGVIALVGASLAWALGSVASHRSHLPASPAMATGMKMLGGGAQLAVVALVTGEGQRATVDQVSPASWIALWYLIIFGSVIGFTAFTYLLRVTTPDAVNTSSYVNPAVAVVLGWAFANEIITGKMIIGALISLGGVVLIRWPTRKEPPPPEVDVGNLETGEFPIPTR